MEALAVRAGAGPGRAFSPGPGRALTACPSPPSPPHRECLWPSPWPWWRRPPCCCCCCEGRLGGRAAPSPCRTRWPSTRCGCWTRRCLGDAGGTRGIAGPLAWGAPDGNPRAPQGWLSPRSRPVMLPGSSRCLKANCHSRCLWPCSSLDSSCWVHPASPELLHALCSLIFGYTHGMCSSGPGHRVSWFYLFKDAVGIVQAGTGHSLWK